MLDWNVNIVDYDSRKMPEADPSTCGYNLVANLHVPAVKPSYERKLPHYFSVVHDNWRRISDGCHTKNYEGKMRALRPLSPSIYENREETARQLRQSLRNLTSILPLFQDDRYQVSALLRLDQCL
jgi:hypothetical protein